MVEPEKYEEIVTTAYKRMHSSTCAEASLEGLLKLWGIPKKDLTWATAGYGGAIQSGKSTCGILIGTGCALSFLSGRNLEGTPEEHPEVRAKAVKMVNKFYRKFLREFGDTQCKKLCGHDFSDPQDVLNYMNSKKWKTTCDVYLKFIMEYGRKLIEKREK